MILPISAKLLFSVRAFSISTRCSNVKCFRLPLLFIFISNLHRQAISCKYSIHSNGYQRQYICAEVISIRLEFTLANWKLKIHLSNSIKSGDKSGTTRTYVRYTITSNDTDTGQRKIYLNENLNSGFGPM